MGAALVEGAFCNISMNGQDVFKFAVRAVPDTVGKSLAAAGKTSEVGVGCRPFPFAQQHSVSSGFASCVLDE